MDFYIGTLMPFPWDFVPVGWMACNGQLLPIQNYSALFSLLGTTYGGDGSTTFALPLLNDYGGTFSRVVMGQGTGPGLSDRQMGMAIGSDTVTLLSMQMPGHSHPFAVRSTPTGGETSVTPVAGGSLADSRVGQFVQGSTGTATMLSPMTIGFAGGGQGHENEQPYLSLFWCIAYQGIWPPRSSVDV